MDTREALLAAIAAAPDDDTPRLVYADWLDDHGDPARAEFIRVQCELARHPSDSSQAVRLNARADDLFTEHGPGWIKAVAAAAGCEKNVDCADAPVDPFDPFTRVSYSIPGAPPSFAVAWRPDTEGTVLHLTLSRGFVDAVTASDGADAGALLAGVFRVEPASRLSLRLATARPAGHASGQDSGVHPARPPWPVAPPDTLRRIRHLELEFDSDVRAGEYLRAVVTDPHLEGLTGLRVTAGLNWDHPFDRPVLHPSVLVPLTTSPLMLRVTALGVTLDRSGLEVLARSGCRASVLDLSESRLSGAGALLAALPFRNHVRKLDLRYTQLGTADIAALAGSDWPALEELNLSANELTDGTARTLENARWVRQLRRLELRCNHFSEAGLKHLRAATDPGRLVYFDAENPVSHQNPVTRTRQGAGGLFGRIVRLLTGM